MFTFLRFANRQLVVVCQLLFLEMKFQVGAMAAMVPLVVAQPAPPAKVGQFVAFRGYNCDVATFQANVDFQLAQNAGNMEDCMRGCEDADRCTSFTLSTNANGLPTCTYWFNGKCSSVIDMEEAEGTTTTFVSTAVLAAEVTTVAATTTKVTTTAVAGIETTVEAATVSENVYALKYPQQACAWSDFVEDKDWSMESDSNDAEACAEACIAHDGCTGFEIGSDSGPNFGNGPYCAFWLDGACSTPTESFYGAVSFSTGEEISVDTYTLTTPIDAFVEYSNAGCAWSGYVEGEEWAFANRDSDDASACATLCLEAAGDGCTGFEVGVAGNSDTYGDLTNGYCAFWYNSTCDPSDMMTSHEASTYLLVGSKGCSYSYTQHLMYVTVAVFSLMACLGVCCCCRRAMIRRRLALQRARAVRARRAATGAAVAATVTTIPSRAVVYAIRAEETQEEPHKV